MRHLLGVLVSAVFVLGAGPLPGQDVLMEFTGDAEDAALGTGLAGGGDADADGVPDILIGSGDGRAWLRSGRDGSVLHQLDNPVAGSRFGFSVAFVGDVDRDGHDDFLVGAPGDSGADPRSGSAELFSGRTGQSLFKWWGGSLGHNFGWAVAGGADFDQDGWPDVVVGAPREQFLQQPGYARVFSGRNGALLANLRGITDHDLYGAALAIVGDADADGVPDLAIGAPNAHFLFGPKGEVRVYSGSDFTLHRSHEGSAFVDSLGGCVGPAGDVDGDGFADYVASAARISEVSIWSGRNGRLLHRFKGNPDERLGTSCALLGDANHDGRADFLLGAPGKGAGGSEDRGAAEAYSGASGGLLHRFEGAGDGDHLGTRVAHAGDVNQDGYTDLLLAAPRDDTAFAGAGRVFVIAGFVLFRQLAPAPGLAGVTNTLEVRDAQPGHRIAFFYGFAAGRTDVPACAGQWVDLALPQLIGVETASPLGAAAIDVPVPPAASGLTVLLQAFDVDACTVSDRAAFAFP